MENRISGVNPELFADPPQLQSACGGSAKFFHELFSFVLLPILLLGRAVLYS
jgi:hypothetical protein